MDDSAPAATVTVHRDEDGVVAVVLTGELDASTTPAVQAQIEAALDGATAVGLDCAGVTFCDSAGLATLITISNRVGSEVPVRIVDPSPVVARLVELTGSTELFA